MPGPKGRSIVGSIQGHQCPCSLQEQPPVWKPRQRLRAQQFYHRFHKMEYLNDLNRHIKTWLDFLHSLLAISWLLIYFTNQLVNL
jgi:hypothetical protein